MGLGENILTQTHLSTDISILPTRLSPTLLTLLLLPLVLSALHHGISVWRRTPSVVYELPEQCGSPRREKADTNRRRIDRKWMPAWQKKLWGSAS
ncbi:uncharacterized protein KD926_006124 [Aspergillus affinis]|uniref:uncharacterized protein n=1 Tax=Aspergillus affinis TaxID=1070780 RepID=UPI0022FE5998|nr:uncharacterized protein KD926_006124 [Aspergillus affinis]KAI9042204.1 hypothetical protein KD926_006124 [Aspergillus affinis]